MSTTDIIEQAEALISRGVNRSIATDLVATFGTDNVKRTIARFDEERRKRDISAGVLVTELRALGRPGRAEPTPAPCPCTPQLAHEWRVALDSFSNDYALMWAGKCHPHRHDAAGWTFGADAWVLGWIGKYLPVIRRELGEQVHIVKCDNHQKQGDSS